MTKQHLKLMTQKTVRPVYMTKKSLKMWLGTEKKVTLLGLKNTS